MKILAIRGQNIASLEEEFEIRFDREPLLSAGIFAITGPTGAGKSSLLDALCLALYNNAPRLNKSEQLKINEDTPDNITLGDSRNILRKGASEGYAGVDFVGLDGEIYRSTWSVRRAYGKAEGKLGNVSLRLENISRGKEEQGKLRELKEKISKIIGLTFEQFTRAVLLAQGDFATFLKADKNEKAGLLENLTGTDIYSSISSLIYQRTDRAESDLHSLEEKMKEIRILGEEGLASYQKEKDTIKNELKRLLSDKQSLEKRKEWFEQEARLEKELLQAENDLREVREKINESDERYRYMSLIDLSLSIRDDYLKNKEKRQQYEKIKSGIIQNNELLKQVLFRHGKTESDLKSLQKQADEFKHQYNRIKPEIEKAKELDFKIESLQEKEKEGKDSLQEEKKKYSASEQNIYMLKKSSEKSGKEIKDLENWFEIHKNYQNIVTKTEMIVSLLDENHTIKEQCENSEKSLELCKKTLEKQKNRLDYIEKEEKRLNQLMPSEIIEIRKKLIEGTPCPVCGNTHHPYSSIISGVDSSGIDENALEEEKKKNEKEKEELKNEIENTRKNITSFETYIKNYEEIYRKKYKNLRNELDFIPQWEIRIEKNTLQSDLASFEKGWNKKLDKLEKEKQNLQNTGIRLESLEKIHITLKDNIDNKTIRLQSLSDELQRNIKERKNLLKGFPVEKTEKYYTSSIEKNAHDIETIKKEKELSDAEKAKLNGTLDQLKKEEASLKEEIAESDEKVTEWIGKNRDLISPDKLENLMQHSREWIKGEKQFLDNLKKRELVCLTTYEERQKKIKEHSLSFNKPDKNTKESDLKQAEEETERRIGTNNKRLNEIDYLLRQDTEGKERIKSFEKELYEKKQLYENWSKLNALLGSANGNKFKAIAQGYTLDVLLGYANSHLRNFSPRYILEKIPGTLALQVIDNDMLGEVRPVNSLSGGETFLVSLALALGLSSLSSDRMNIETLFIDEGFGSLDSETLGIAMDALDHLQMQGRKIGVISHVEEMKERIKTQIEVIKKNNGKSILRIIG